MEFRVLGPLEVASGGNTLPCGGPKQRALLAFLLLHANEAVGRDRLMEALWGDDPPSRAANALQVHVHGLRKLLGRERLETRGSAYVLRVEPGELDAERFDGLLQQARAAEDPAARIELIGAALGLWRGAPLSDLADAPFAQLESQRLEEARLAALELRIEAELALGLDDGLVAELEGLAAAHPYRERLRAQLMVALYRAGRQADALDAFQQARRVLVDELGIDPSRELQDLERAILRQDPSLTAGAAPPRPAPELPAAPTPLVGRRLELAAASALFRGPDVRLLTLTGPGGIGKTRLALALAAELSDGFPGGVWFVDLAPVFEPELVAATVAHTLGVDESSRPVAETIAEQLGDRSALLVLDNFEHVLDAAGLVSELLRRAPRLRALVTSRSVLSLAGEHEYPVPPLPLPELVGTPEPASLGENEAVELFVTRARAARPDFRLTHGNADAVARICIELDGLPLALELAAARVKLLAPDAILARLAGRLDLLTTSGRDVPARQQTLRAAIDWSYRLLEPDEQLLFSRLAVFAGGFTVAAAEAVCDADLDSLTSLVDKSLVGDDGAGAEPRFRLLETIREYARERLEASGDADELRRRHADHFLGLAEQGEQAFAGGQDQEAWLERLEREHDNVRAALEWLGRTGEVDRELRLGTALLLFWKVRGHLTEGRRRLEDALARAVGADPARVAEALEAAGGLAYRQGDYDRSRALSEQSLALYRDLGEAPSIARMLHELGSIELAEGHYEQALPMYEESVELVRQSGDRRRYSIGLSNLGALMHELGDFTRALSLQEDALGIQREVGDRDAVAMTLHNLARTELRMGRPDRCRELLAESLHVSRELGYRELIAYCLEGFGEFAIAAGDDERAARLLGAADALFQRLGVPMHGSERESYDQAVVTLRASLGDDAFAAAEAAGRELDPERAVEDALHVELAGGDD